MRHESYLPTVFKLLMERADPQEIADYLVRIERASMGLDGNLKKAEWIAEILAEYREMILDRPA